jgi:hypothetical protein
MLRNSRKSEKEAISRQRSAIAPGTAPMMDRKMATACEHFARNSRITKKEADSKQHTAPWRPLQHR